MDPCHICILPETARPTVADAKLTLQAQAGMIGRGEEKEEEEVQSFVRGYATISLWGGFCSILSHLDCIMILI